MGKKTNAMRATEPKRKKLKSSWDDKLFSLIIALVLTLLFVFFLYPVWFVLIASISNPDLVYTGEVTILPKDIDFGGYVRVFKNSDVWTGYANTIFYTFVGTLMNVAVTTMVGYAVSRRDLRGGKIIMTLFIITMYFGGGMIPEYLNVKGLGLTNTRFFMLINGLVGPTNVIICRTFFRNSIPWEMQEAAFIDGASDFYVFTKIILPLSKAILAVMCITYAVGHWNSYFSAMIYLKDDIKYPLQVFLREILIQSDLASMMVDDTNPDALATVVAAERVANQLKYALIVVSTVPILSVYPFVEKYFEKGFMIGGIKG